MKFEFAFEKLLAHKRSLEDLARRGYLEAEALVVAAKKELDGFYGHVEDSRLRSARLESRGGPMASALAQIDEFIRGQKIRIERQKLRLRDLMAEAERRQEILIEAAKERKTLEKLRERRLSEFRLRRKKNEMKAVDELVVTRFKRDDERSEGA